MKITHLIIFILMAGTVSAYSHDTVNVTWRTDGSDLAQRGTDTIIITANQANTSQLGAYLIWMFFAAVIVMIAGFFNPGIFRRFLGAR